LSCCCITRKTRPFSCHLSIDWNRLRRTEPGEAVFETKLKTVYVQLGSLGLTSFKLKYSMIKRKQCPKAINCLNIRFDLPVTNLKKHITPKLFCTYFIFRRLLFETIFQKHNKTNWFLIKYLTRTAPKAILYISNNNQLKEFSQRKYEQLIDLCFYSSHHYYSCYFARTSRAFVKLFLPMIDNNNQYIHYINTYIHI